MTSEPAKRADAPEVGGAATSSPTAETVDTKALLKALIEFGPLVTFFIANSYGGIFVGTAALMLATPISLVACRVLFHSTPVMPLVSGAFVLVFGGLTLALQDELFIKMKPTIVNTLFAVILLGGLAFGTSLLRYVFGEVFRLTPEGWRVLTIRWALFFLFLAVLNEVIWRSFSTDVWVNFKVFGIMPLTMAFAVSQIGLLKRYEAPAETRG